MSIILCEVLLTCGSVVIITGLIPKLVLLAYKPQIIYLRLEWSCESKLVILLREPPLFCHSAKGKRHPLFLDRPLLDGSRKDGYQGWYDLENQLKLYKKSPSLSIICMLNGTIQSNYGNACDELV